MLTGVKLDWTLLNFVHWSRLLDRTNVIVYSICNVHLLWHVVVKTTGWMKNALFFYYKEANSYFNLPLVPPDPLRPNEPNISGASCWLENCLNYRIFPSLQIWIRGQCAPDATGWSETDSCSGSRTASGMRSVCGARRAERRSRTPAFCGTANFTASGTTLSEWPSRKSLFLLDSPDVTAEYAKETQFSNQAHFPAKCI